MHIEAEMQVLGHVQLLIMNVVSADANIKIATCHSMY